jgi:hypothetical protein
MRTSTQASYVTSRTLPVATYYYPIDALDDETTSISLKYTGGVATLTLQGTNLPKNLYADNDTTAAWQDVPVAVTAISASGGQLLSFGNLGCRRLRLKVVVATQVTGFEMYPWGVA